MSIEEFEAKSFRNLINFYSDELTEIQNGRLATDNLTDRERINLKKRGVLYQQPNHDTGGWRSVPTLETIKILEEETQDDA
uniref:Uncharacterized protein n=1 Tax=viral metagenome TaxID=1070528 RepID=A0A6M3M8S7_9ZZZZ